MPEKASPLAAQFVQQSQSVQRRFSTQSGWIRQDQRSPEQLTGQSHMERDLEQLRNVNRLLREERDMFN